MLSTWITLNASPSMFSWLSCVAVNFRVWSDETAIFLYTVLRPKSLCRDSFVATFPSCHKVTPKYAALTKSHATNVLSLSFRLWRNCGYSFWENLRVFFRNGRCARLSTDKTNKKKILTSKVENNGELFRDRKKGKCRCR